MFARLYQISWVRARFAERRDDRSWSLVAGLLVRDFHSDINSLMDSIPSVIVAAHDRLRPKDIKKPPGFADLHADSPRTFRKRLPQSIIGIVDATNRWWPPIKSVRDLLMHRRHDQLVFGDQSEGILFQVYLAKGRHRIKYAS